MRIRLSPINTSALQRRLDALERFVAAPTDREQRPCSSCRLPCPCSGSMLCTCSCSPACPSAPHAMSSEPEAFPIEPNIIPLVYALNSLRLCSPCWSCEGHIDRDGGLRRKPSVWITADSTVYPALMAEYVGELYGERELVCPWRISVVSWGSCRNTTFAIEPDLAGYPNLRLGRLWQDVRTIAAGLHAGTASHARRFRVDVSRALTGGP